jgi:hypothetical protein
LILKESKKVITNLLDFSRSHDQLLPGSFLHKPGKSLGMRLHWTKFKHKSQQFTVEYYLHLAARLAPIFEVHFSGSSDKNHYNRIYCVCWIACLRFNLVVHTFARELILSSGSEVFPGVFEG